MEEIDACLGVSQLILVTREDVGHTVVVPVAERDAGPAGTEEGRPSRIEEHRAVELRSAVRSPVLVVVDRSVGVAHEEVLPAVVVPVGHCGIRVVPRLELRCAVHDQGRSGEQRILVRSRIDEEMDLPVILAGKNVLLPVVVPVDHEGRGVPIALEIALIDLQAKVAVEQGIVVRAGIDVDPDISIGLADKKVFLAVAVPVRHMRTRAAASAVRRGDGSTAGENETPSLEDGIEIRPLIQEETDGAAVLHAHEEVLPAVVVPVRHGGRRVAVDYEEILTVVEGNSRLEHRFPGSRSPPPEPEEADK